MSYKLHILIDHEATNVSKALGLTEQQGEEFKEKAIDLVTKVSEVMLGETDNRVKKTQLMEEIQENFSPAEILLLALHDIEAQAVKICEMKSNPLGMLVALLASASSDKKEYHV